MSESNRKRDAVKAYAYFILFKRTRVGIRKAPGHHKPSIGGSISIGNWRLTRAGGTVRADAPASPIWGHRQAADFESWALTPPRRPSPLPSEAHSRAVSPALNAMLMMLRGRTVSLAPDRKHDL